MKLIIINLLAEEEQAEQARARDPVKILAALSMGLLAMVVAIGGVLAGVALRSGVALNEVERQLQTLEKQQTSGTIGAYRSLKQWTDDLLEINQSRQLYAPQLALIKNLVPDFIQLTRLSLVTTVVAHPPVAPPAATNIKAQLAQRSPPTTQVLTLQLEGKVISARPEEDVANFRRALETDATLSAQIQQVQLRSFGRMTGQSERNGSVVGQFVIECLYKEHP